MLENNDTKNVAASAAVYRVDHANNTFEYRSDDPALAYGGDGLVKSQFQAVHKGEADAATEQRFLSAYQTDIETFRQSMRTVGVGTNIILRGGQGTGRDIRVPMVARTETGPDGTVALGKQSRAAGGAFGDLAASGFRELSEEFICARDLRDDTLIIYNLVYDDPSLRDADVEEILGRKNAEAEEIIQTYGLSSNGHRFEQLAGHVMHVDGLTQSVTQLIDGEANMIANRVLTDNPAAGDFAGVDTIIYAELPTGVSFADLTVHDGERNFDGDLLKRTWSLEAPETWIARLDDGMKMSPAPKQVFDNWDKVELALQGT